MYSKTVHGLPYKLYRLYPIIVMAIFVLLFVTGCSGKVSSLARDLGTKAVGLIVFLAGVASMILTAYHGLRAIGSSAIQQSNIVGQLILSISVTIIGLLVAVIGPSLINDVVGELNVSGELNFPNPYNVR